MMIAFSANNPWRFILNSVQNSFDSAHGLSPPKIHCRSPYHWFDWSCSTAEAVCTRVCATPKFVLTGIEAHGRPLRIECETSEWRPPIRCICVILINSNYITIRSLVDGGRFQLFCFCTIHRQSRDRTKDRLLSHSVRCQSIAIVRCIGGEFGRHFVFKII